MAKETLGERIGYPDSGKKKKAEPNNAFPSSQAEPRSDLDAEYAEHGHKKVQGDSGADADGMPAKSSYEKMADEINAKRKRK